MPFDDAPPNYRPSRKLRFSIDLACNDPDTGIEVGQCRAISVCDGALESDDRIFGHPLRLVELEEGIRLAGKFWPITSSAYGVGNWCWNGYGMQSHIIVQFLIWMRQRKLFSNWEGECELVKFMSYEREMSPFEIRAQLDSWLMAG